MDGPFDRLAVLAAGHFHPGEVIALGETAVPPNWLCQVRAVLLACARYSSTRARTPLTEQLAWNRIAVEICPLSSRDSHWSECWRREGIDGLEALYASHALLAHGI